MFKNLREAITDRIARPLWKFGARLFPDRPRRKRSWAYLKKAAAVWLGRDKSTIWLYCDLPNIYSADPLEVTGPLAFRGWALSMRGISAITFYCDGAFVGEASRGISRPDVAVLASHLRQSARCGFFYLLDSRALSAGLHELTVKAESYDGSSLARTCMLDVLYSADDYTAWRRKTAASSGMLAWMKRHEHTFLERPCISLILPLRGETESAGVPSTIRSLQEQVYSHWQLHIISDKPAYEKLGESVLESARDDPRINFRVEPFAAGSEGQ
ncbi:MAG TPA: hypothetical protein VGY58_09145, partial [Gemmataceae bacterium]|nr:hypothetical protein [Gemmataceae bacterium]